MSLLSLLPIAVLLAVVPALIHHFKWYWLISGYSTMPEERRRNIDWDGFSRFMRNAFFIVSLALVAGFFIFEAFEASGKYPVFFLVMVVGSALVIIILGNKKYNYLKKGGLPSNIAIPQRSGKKSIAITLGITAVFIFSIFYFGTKDPVAEVANGNLTVKGMYGFSFPAESIKADTVSSIPDISMRTNGFSGGGVRKGYFKLTNGEIVKLFVNTRSEPVIRIEQQDGNTIYMNFSDPAKTRSLFRRLITTK